jgi:aryl-alcohol dehydrogenase-like predicted oxidoreductase
MAETHPGPFFCPAGRRCLSSTILTRREHTAADRTVDHQHLVHSADARWSGANQQRNVRCQMRVDGGDCLSEMATMTVPSRHARSPAQVVLRWLVENETVLPIPGAKNGQQAAANAGVLSLSLVADEIAALNRVTRALRTPGHR